ncbi:MAG: TRAP transporter small permease [Rhodospirillales bacterium]|nr:TRAP transporter small permease [Rhodospirillales bacterium]
MEPKSSPITAWMMRVNLACAFLSGVALLMMMAVGAADIIGTNLNWLGLPSRPIPGSFEFIGTMMVMNVFLAVSLGQARRGHIQVELVVQMLPPPLQRAAAALHHTLSCGFFAMIAWASWPGALHSVRVGEFSAGLVNYPIWPARAVLAFGASLMAVQCLLDLAGVFSKRFRVARERSSDAATV